MDSRIEVFSKTRDARAQTRLKKIIAMGYKETKKAEIADVYTIASPSLGEKDLEKCGSLLSNPVTQNFLVSKPFTPDFDFAIEIGFLPGVTDNTGNTAAETISDIFGKKAEGTTAYYSQILFLSGKLSEKEAKEIGERLANHLIQRIHVKSREQFLKENGMGLIIPKVRLNQSPEADEIDLSVSDGELVEIGKKGILGKNSERRGPLALDLESMKIIRDYFKSLGRKPTDIELESLAQTWSEHCKHTIFAAELDEIKGGLFKEKIRKATEIAREKKGAKDRCVSVFTDNSGGIIFDKNFLVTHKVETHNSPSALDPFGGAITGIVGVNRDTMGFGIGAKPAVNIYGFCFADPKDTKLLYRLKEKQNPILPPERIMLGVIEGVNVGGNCSGIPTPQGFMYFDERYKGKPLVFVGTLGLIPRLLNGKDSTQKKAVAGDAIVMVGNRVGQDGIHGATFSSEALSSGSPATAVQIGDPITQKKMSDAIVKEARDMNLYDSITDNGAGGLSCSVAEMAKECNGCVVELEKVPLKYPGMQPWKTWVSESQERMTLAIPRQKTEKFIELMQRRGVEATIIGEFNDSEKCIVKNNGKTIMQIDLKFLHDGLPKKKLQSKKPEKKHPEPGFQEEKDLSKTILEMLSRLNICSKEFISTQYDHEVQGTSVLKPLQGKGKVNAETSAVRPVLESKKGVAVSQALYPRYGDIDSYDMAACAIDSAIKNLIAAGTKPEDIVLLDNFCWCSSLEPEKLGELKQAVQACFDLAVKFETPFISGKDSMFNDFKGFDENNNPVKVSVPPTLLISSMGIIEDIEKCVSMDAKISGDLVYVLGETKNELGGGEFFAMKNAIGNNVPKVDAEKAIALYAALSKAIEKGLVSSCQPVSLGGIGIGIAKTCLAGNLGAKIDLKKVPATGIERNDYLLFSESQSRLVVTIAESNKKEFEDTMKTNVFAQIGMLEGKTIEIKGLNRETIAKTGLEELNEAYKKTLGDY